MGFERPKTIKEVIQNIEQRKYLLPAIQREFVWSSGQIIRLFDSLMKGYPIGSFLFWEVKKNKISEYQFYEFIKYYHERDKKHNPKAKIINENDIIAILDGQQRLTSLYIGLLGTYAEKIRYKRWDNDNAFPETKLYIDLLNKSDLHDMKYKFVFLEDDKAKKENLKNERHWFKVEDVLGFNEDNPSEAYSYLIKNSITTLEDIEAVDYANKTIFRLHQLIHKDEVINYFLEEDQDLDKVLNIFIRVNSGGTELSYSDLLLSIATAQWEEKDAREEIYSFVDKINNIGDGYRFSKDFVLKSCLVLSDFKDIGFKVENFTHENMIKIEKNWNGLKEAIYMTIKLIYSFGFHEKTLPSANALIPISYYLYKKDDLPHNYVASSRYKQDRDKIRKWLSVALLKKTFSGQPDNVLRPIREVINSNNNYFPKEKIYDKLLGTNKSMRFEEEEIDNLLDVKYGGRYTFSVLALLYPHLDFRNKFHQDHIFPRSKFTPSKLRAAGIKDEEIEFYLDKSDRLGNLQLLEGVPNEEKSDCDFKKWFNNEFDKHHEKENYKSKHYIPDVNFDFTNFKNFINEREEILKDELKSIL